MDNENEITNETKDLNETIKELGAAMEANIAPKPAWRVEPGNERGKVGNAVQEDSILSYAAKDGKCIVVTARRAGEGAWMVRGESHGELRVMASVFGGRWFAAEVCRYLRNGLMSRADRHRRKKANKRAREASGAFHTPKAAVDAIMANPPMGEGADAQATE